ncbi:MAG TPA: hypothetical protein VKM37_06280 [Balneolaceae bacterium]|nr:hypothetical protein [Balneolaceae bacterium]
MTDKKEKDQKAEKEKKKDQKKKDLNDELRQTFPASDPPAQSRPGHDRDNKS